MKHANADPRTPSQSNQKITFLMGVAHPSSSDHVGADVSFVSLGEDEIDEMLRYIGRIEELQDEMPGLRQLHLKDDRATYFFEDEEEGEASEVEEVALTISEIADYGDIYPRLIAPEALTGVSSRKPFSGESPELIVMRGGVYWHAYSGAQELETGMISVTELLEAQVWIGSPEASQKALRNLSEFAPKAAAKFLDPELRLPGRPDTTPQVRFTRDMLENFLKSQDPETRRRAMLAVDRFDSEPQPEERGSTPRR